MICKHYNFSLVETHRHYINSEEHNNCVLCLVDEKGPMSYSEIGKYLDLTPTRVLQIEKWAVKKLSKRTNFLFENE